ncbi:thermonuclease family protein [Candidatus Daviesbacteria bacterium]|nr:thermonuclease family protein [Candidatus Daviesbacteria bacterium]
MDRNSKILSLLTLVILLGGLFLLWQILTSFEKKEATFSSVIGIEGEKVAVTKVIDGDTIEIEGGKKVRYLGIDTPETKDPRRAVECFGKQAYMENKQLVEGEQVILQKDVSETDKYNRLLRYVFLPLDDGNILFVNDYLIREGFATALTYPPDVKYSEQFLKAQQQAKESKKGLWGEC